MSALEAWCDEYLAPSPLDGETLRFDLSAYRSRVTREMLQARLRKTPQAFGASERSLDANITPDGTALEVDAAALMAANAVVKDRLWRVKDRFEAGGGGAEGLAGLAAQFCGLGEVVVGDGHVGASG